MSDDIRPTRDADSYVAQWRIQEFLGGGTYCINVNDDGCVDPNDIRHMIAVEIDEDYLSSCRVEFREMDADDESWQVLNGPPDDWSHVNKTGDILIGLLEEAQREGLVLSEADRSRLVRLLDGGAE